MAPCAIRKKSERLLLGGGVDWKLRLWLVSSGIVSVSGRVLMSRHLGVGVVQRSLQGTPSLVNEKYRLPHLRPQNGGSAALLGCLADTHDGRA